VRVDDLNQLYELSEPLLMKDNFTIITIIVSIIVTAKHDYQ